RRRIVVINQRFLKTLTKNHRSPSIAICGEFKSGQDIFHPRPSDHLDIAGGLSSEIIYIYYVRNTTEPSHNFRQHCDAWLCANINNHITRIEMLESHDPGQKTKATFHNQPLDHMARAPRNKMSYPYHLYAIDSLASDKLATVTRPALPIRGKRESRYNSHFVTATCEVGGRGCHVRPETSLFCRIVDLKQQNVHTLRCKTYSAVCESITVVIDILWFNFPVNRLDGYCAARIAGRFDQFH